MGNGLKFLMGVVCAVLISTSMSFAADAKPGDFSTRYNDALARLAVLAKVGPQDTKDIKKFCANWVIPIDNGSTKMKPSQQVHEAAEDCRTIGFTLDGSKLPNGYL